MHFSVGFGPNRNLGFCFLKKIETPQKEVIQIIKGNKTKQIETVTKKLNNVELR